MRKKLSQAVWSLIVLTAVFPVLAEDKDIADIMEQYDTEGTVVIVSLDDNTAYIHNDTRANTRLSPASTFKIPHSIIALEEGALENQHQLLSWDGTKYEFKAWNQDQNLKSAFQSSCVWFYQEIAKQVSSPTYVNYLTQMNYGNAMADEGITFWLGDGDLKISPMEQVAFLQKLYLKQLPVSDSTYAILEDSMLDEDHTDYTIYAKTGAATKNWLGHGWYVGYVTTDNETWGFATNILINEFEDLEKRKKITLDVLKKKDII